MLKTAKGDDGTWNTANVYLVYTRKSGVVFVKTVGSGGVTLTNNTWSNIGTIPYAPKSEVGFVAIDRSNLKPMQGRITTAGVVSLYPEGGNCSYWAGDASFPIMGGGN
jgi:hypothetical protein